MSRRQTKLEIVDGPLTGEIVIPAGKMSGSDSGSDLICGSCSAIVLADATLEGASRNAAASAGRMIFKCSCGKYNILPTRVVGTEGIV